MCLKSVMFVQSLYRQHNMNENLVQVEDSSFVRDIHSKAILNTDRIGLQNYYIQRDLHKKEQAEKLLAIDIPKYEDAAKRPLGDSWNKLNQNQKIQLLRKGKCKVRLKKLLSMEI